MLYDLVIKNGFVVSTEATIKCDVAIKGEKIVALGNFDKSQATKIIDAKNKYVLPGCIEAHMHCQAPFQGCLGANTFYEQSISAAFGGVTTFMDFANMSVKDSPYQQALARLDEMSESAIDYSAHGKIIQASKEILVDIEKLVKFGIPTFKMFMTYKKEGVMSTDETMLKVFKLSKTLNVLPMLHCESNPIAELNIQNCVKEGKLTWRDFANCKPIECEAEAFTRALQYAKYINCAILVVHTTNKLALDAARIEQTKGFPVYIETCPHYLTLFDNLYDGDDGHLAVCSPPLRTPKDADDLWQGLIDGTILLTGSDDCTFKRAEKEMFLQKSSDGKIIQDFTKVVNGLSGLEIRLPLLLSEGVNKNKFSINKLVALTSTNIAKIYGCYPQKGVIAVGSDADITIVDLDKTMLISKDTLHNNCDYCLHEGFVAKGCVETTILRGEIIVENGTFKGTKGAGKFIRRKINSQYLEKYGLN
ncbi:dihydropyrimidinase [Campylobacter sp. MG1]|uniref:dihydropyrimidinase n=1 Tax=Campylobacter sp. MG1 TaxID=2976332 RepID=UPI00226D097E|nr:dihydropyrimidinase [Campylobacter sp. MG1]